VFTWHSFTRAIRVGCIDRGIALQEENAHDESYRKSTQGHG
jgi:hypothetical protein